MRESRFSFDMIACVPFQRQKCQAAVEKEMKRRDFYANVTKLSENIFGDEDERTEVDLIVHGMMRELK